MIRTIRIGTRGSALARAQARLIADALERQPAWPRTELHEVVTEGDRTQHTTIQSAGWGRGVFVKDLERALLRGEVDLAVHSLKDVPPDRIPGLEIAAVPPREDPRDVLVTLEGRALQDLAGGTRVGTSSARRTAFLRASRPDLVYVPIRGNVDTRYRKLQAGDYDALVLAEAGLARLGMDIPRVVLSVDLLLPPPGQGALGLQIRTADAELHRLLQPLNDPATAAAVHAERALMRELDGSCSLPVAALGDIHGDELWLAAAVASPDGTRVLRVAVSGPSRDPEAIGSEAARCLRDQGALELVRASEQALSA